MDVKHNVTPSCTEILLTELDIRNFSDLGYVMTRGGLVGSDTKTWVVQGSPEQSGTAEIDTDNDLRVYMDRGTALPLVIPQASIDAPADLDRSRVESYYGEDGKIIVQAHEIE